jgi:hypothetical protein
MTRLRREEEARAYAAMTKTSSSLSTALGSPDALDSESLKAAAKEVDEQVRMILNFFVSVVGVFAAVFMLARWWDGPSRVLLALGSALATATAEGVIFCIYSDRQEEKKEKVKRLARGLGGGGGDVIVVGRGGVGEKGGDGLRKRVVGEGVHHSI